MMQKPIVAAFSCVLCLAAAAKSVSLDLSPRASSGMRRLSAEAPDSQLSGQVRSHRLEAGVARISGLAVGDVIAFKLFSDKTLSVTLVEENPSLEGRAFVGRIDNALNALGCVVLETEDGVVLDVTDFEHQRVWQVISDESGVIVREVKPVEEACYCGTDTPSAVDPSLTVVTDDAASLVAGSEPSASVSSTVASVPGLASSLTTTSSGYKPTVDILVCYDLQAAVWAKANGGGLTSFAETCVQKMNTAIANTGLDQYFRFRLVGVLEIGKSVGGDLQTSLNLASGTKYYSPSGTLEWSCVGEERKRVGADIVCTLCDNGKAYGLVGLGKTYVSTLQSVNCGFNACQIRAVATMHTMTHEVGHNMGAGHTDQMKDGAGNMYYKHSQGYYFYVGDVGYHTIMAYNTDGYDNFYTSVPYFSSPNHTYGGVVIGDATHDNTRTFLRNYTNVVNNIKVAYNDPDIGDGFDATDYVWTTDGNYPWTRVTDSSNDGVDSSRSFEMSGKTTSWTETKVVGPATLSFKLRLQCTNGYFRVRVNGAQKHYSGGTSVLSPGDTWNSVSVAIPEGTNTVRLEYGHSGISYVEGNNGAWVDQLTFIGGSPAPKYTTTTFLPIPYSWLAEYYPTVSESGYETLAVQKGANGYALWESYVAGLNPTNETSQFKAVITMEDGLPVVKCEPELTPAEAALRKYTVYGKQNLSDSNWVEMSPGDEVSNRFFKVSVELK